MRTTIAATVVIVIAALASAAPVEAHCTWGHPRHCIKKVGEALKEAGRDIDDEVLQPVKEAAEEAGRDIDDEVLQPVKEAAEEAGRDIDDEVLQPVKEAAEEAGRDIDDEVLQPVKDYLTRCYDRAEREPDPQTREARWKECEERPTGAILGTVGLAAGSYFGPVGAAGGSLAGSVLGSAIDGAPKVFVTVHGDLPATEPPDLRQPHSPNDDSDASASPSPDSAPNRSDQQHVPSVVTPDRQPSSRAALGTALQLVPEIFEWLGIANVPVQLATFEQDRIKLASQVPVGKTVDTWVLVQGNAYSAMTLNPDGFWIGPGHEQHRIEIIGTMDAHASGGECNHPSHPPLCHGDSPAPSIP